MINRLFIFISISLPLLLNAQSDTLQLNPITVAASMSPQQISKTGRNIIIIGSELIQKLPASSVDEIIRYLPGVEVQSRGPMGTQSNITIRGGTFQQVLIIIDGIRLNDPLTGHFNSYIPITPYEIERIEILKGPAAAIYGSDAVGGVVHIITKTFSAKPQAEGYRINGQLSAGDFGLMNGQVSGSLHLGSTHASAALQSNNAEGQRLRGTLGFFNLTTFTAAVRQQIGKSISLAYRYGNDNRDFNAQNFYSGRLSDFASEKVIGNWHHAKATYQFQKHFLSLDYGDKSTTDEFKFNKSANPNINRSRLRQTQLLYQYQLNDNFTIAGGAQHIDRAIISNDRGNHSVQNAGVFAYVHTQIAKSLNIQPGIRGEWNERSGWQVLPQLNMSYPYRNITFRGAIGRTARDADFTERFNNYQRINVPSGNRIGNPDLSAETAMSYEAGADYLCGQQLKISATLFSRNHRDLIDWNRTAYGNMPRKDNLVAGGSYDLASNIAKVQTNGMEMDIHYLISCGKHQIKTGLGLVWMESKSSDTTPSIYVSNHARFLANLYAVYQYNWLNISINGLYKERNVPTPITGLAPLTPSYFLLNARAEAFLNEGKLSFFVQADNLLNRSYADILGSVMPNRWLMGGVRLRL